MKHIFKRMLVAKKTVVSIEQETMDYETCDSPHPELGKRLLCTQPADMDHDLHVNYDAMLQWETV